MESSKGQFLIYQTEDGINSIYEEGELLPEATVKKYLTVRQEGNCQVRRLLDELITKHKIEFRQIPYWVGY